MKYMKEQFTLPGKLAFAKGEKELFSLRIYPALLDEYKKLAKDRGCTPADLIIRALDEYAQWAKAHKSK